MSESGWFADRTNEDDEQHNEDFPWRPFLQLPGVCLPLPIGHPDRESCERFIREMVIGQPMLEDA